jgi:membrane-anchored protein YejM (alkaline phosphatase superfamily)
MGNPWFRVEGTGLAAQPISWQGWAVTLLFVVALVFWAVIAFVVLGPTPTNIIIFILGSLAMTVLLVIIALKKTEGRWAWQRKNSSEQE